MRANNPRPAGRWVLVESIEGSDPRWEPRRQIEAQLDPVGGSTTNLQHAVHCPYELHLMRRTMHYALCTVHYGCQPGPPKLCLFDSNSTRWAGEVCSEKGFQFPLHLDLCCMNSLLKKSSWMKFVLTDTVYCKLCIGWCLHHRETRIRRYGSQPPCQHHQHHQGFWLTGVACYKFIFVVVVDCFVFYFPIACMHGSRIVIALYEVLLETTWSEPR